MTDLKSTGATSKLRPVHWNLQHSERLMQKFWPSLDSIRFAVGKHRFQQFLVRVLCFFVSFSFFVPFFWQKPFCGNQRNMTGFGFPVKIPSTFSVRNLTQKIPSGTFVCNWGALTSVFLFKRQWNQFYGTLTASQSFHAQRQWLVFILKLCVFIGRCLGLTGFHMAPRFYFIFLLLNGSIKDPVRSGIVLLLEQGWCETYFDLFCKNEIKTDGESNIRAMWSCAGSTSQEATGNMSLTGLKRKEYQTEQ